MMLWNRKRARMAWKSGLISPVALPMEHRWLVCLWVGPLTHDLNSIFAAFAANAAWL